MNVHDIIILARKHMYEGPLTASAAVCLSDAIHLRDRGFFDYARQRAIKSLQYSVGIYHADYKRAARP